MADQEQAISYSKDGKISIRIIQKKMKIGYVKAWRIMDDLHNQGKIRTLESSGILGECEIIC